MKTCTLCQECKPLSEYDGHPLGAGGLRSRCRMCLRASLAAYHAANREKISARKRADYDSKKEEHAQRGARYRAARRDVFNYHAAKRRTLKVNATPSWVDTQAIRAIYKEASRLGLTVDHIYPLKHKLFCGLHVPWNLQLLTMAENQKKKNVIFPPLTFVGEALSATHSSG